MTRGRIGATVAVAVAAAAADALRDWLQTQPKAQGTSETTETLSPAVEVAPIAPDPSAVTPIAPAEPAAAPAGPVATTDWLHHRLTVTGPADVVAAFRKKAAGAGTIPWQLDFDRLQEDWFHRLVAPPPPQRRSLSLHGARVLAEQLRDAAERRHARALARVGSSSACPFDLQALRPVPTCVLALGPDHPEALAWLWRHWGTLQALRHVTEARTPKTPPACPAAWEVQFWSADWTPWRAFLTLQTTWPALRFSLRPSYGAA